MLSVCALFIDEVYFRDSASSTGIQIEKISQRKKVTTHRKCTYCDAQGNGLPFKNLPSSYTSN